MRKIKKIFFVTTMLFVVGNQLLIAQTTFVDSLSSLLDNGHSNKTEIYYELFKHYRMADQEKALEYAENGFAIAKANSDSIWMVKTGRAVGWINLQLGYLLTAVKSYQNALVVAEEKGMRKQIIYLLNNLGVAYIQLGDFDKALDYHLKSLKMREEDGDEKGITVSYNNIGLVYYKVSDFEEALRYYLKSLEMNEKIGRQEGIDRNYVNIGLAYVALEEYENALRYFGGALDMCQDNCSNELLMWINHGVGKAMFFENDYDSAEAVFMISKDLAEELKSDRYLMMNFRSMAEVKLKKEKYREAITLLNRANVIAEDLGLTVSKKENYGLFANIYSELKEFEKAFTYQSEFITLKDSLYSNEMAKNLKDILLLDQEERNQRLIDYKDKQIQTSKQLNYLLVLFVTLFSAFLIVLYRNYRSKQRTNKQLEDANAIIESKNEELSNLNVKLEDKVKERTKELDFSNQELKKSNEELDTFIYRTSHDIRGPLASLLGLSEVALIDVSDEKALDYFSKLNQTANSLNEILSRVLDITQIKTASQFDEDIDFESILDEILDKESSLPYYNQIEFNCDIQKDLRFKSDPYLIQTIINNLVDNAFRFYNTSERIESFISVDIHCEGQCLMIKVVDNGVGLGGEDIEKLFEIFSKGSKRRGTAGLGLYLVKLAVERIKGLVEAETNVMGFTEFRVILPLNTNEGTQTVPAA